MRSSQQPNETTDQRLTSGQGERTSLSPEMTPPPRTPTLSLSALQEPTEGAHKTQGDLGVETPHGYDELFQRSSRRLLTFAPALILLIWIGSLLFGANASKHRKVSWKSDSYSHSALGHKAFSELLKRSGWSVTVSRYYSAHQADDATLVSLSPNEVSHQIYDDQEDEARERSEQGSGEYNISGYSLGKLFNRRLRPGQRIIVSLPKRRAVSSAPDEQGLADRWVKSYRLAFIEQSVSILRRVIQITSPKSQKLDSIKYRVHRVPQLTGCVEVNRLGDRRPIKAPKIQLPQVISGSGLTPWVTCDQGILIGEYHSAPEGVEGPQALIIADSDLVSNFAISQHADLVLSHLERFSPRERPLLLDETAHGHLRSFSISETLFSYPVYPLTLQIILLISLILYFAMSRLIPPRARPTQTAKGKRALIEGIAVLLQVRGYSGSACQRYLDHSVSQVARELKLSSSLSQDELIRQLDLIATQRKLKAKLRLSHIYQQVKYTHGLKRFRAESARLAVAMLTYRWKKEMIS